jgi:hydrogenase nickel incorporation protein HypB
MTDDARTTSNTVNIDIGRDFMEKRRQDANANKDLFSTYGIRAFDIMGSIGSGKTTLIQKLTSRLKDKYKIGIIAGDLTTDIDAQRLEQHEVAVVQINTGRECHLDAPMVARAAKKLPLDELDVLFIENVGNLICPAGFPLGVDKQLVVVSVTEGPWMVMKHPHIFREADVVAINKIDLAEIMEVLPDRLLQDVARVNPRARALPISCRKDEGIEAVCQALGL